MLLGNLPLCHALKDALKGSTCKPPQTLGCPRLCPGWAQWHLVGKGEMDEYQLFFGVLTTLCSPLAKILSPWAGGQREGPQGLIPARCEGPSTPPQLLADSAIRDSHSFRQMLPGVNGEEVSQALVINANYRAATWETFLPQVSFQKWFCAGVAPSFTCH